MKNFNRIYSFRGNKPDIDKTVFIAPDATIIGDVKIGSGSSVWFQCVIRGDVNFIRIGANVNIQDMSLLHVTSEKYPLIIGNNVTIAHRVLLHGCTLKNNTFIGMGAIIMDGVEIGEYSIVGAGALVTSGKIIPSHSMVLGSPAKVVRNVTDKEIEMITNSYKNYLNYVEEYKMENIE